MGQTHIFHTDKEVQKDVDVCQVFEQLNAYLAIFLLSKDGEVLWANDYAGVLFCRTYEELLQSKVERLVDVRDLRWADYLEKRKQKGLVRGELAFLRNEGEVFQASFSSSIFTDRNGVERAILVVCDADEPSKALWESKVLSSLVEQNTTAIVVTDISGKIEYVNNRFLSVVDYSLDELKGKTLRMFNQGHLPESVYGSMWGMLEVGKIWQGDVENRTKSGVRFWENVTISPIRDYKGEISNYLLIMVDVTEKKRILDDLIEAKEKAEESDRLKTAFLHNFSHEIRTPVNAIVGFSGLLNDPELLPEKRKFFTDVIVQSSNQLLSIITDIIHIATIEAGQERALEEDVNLNELMRFLNEQFSFKIQGRRIKINYELALRDEEAIILSDNGKLTSILTNLIGNAVKFTNQGSVIFGYFFKGDQLEFYVKDTGIGIPAEMHEKIFERFRQVDYSENRQYGGFGLGLSISKSYVELLGGKIWLNSEPGRGSAFYFTLPYKKAKNMDVSDKQTGKTQDKAVRQQKVVLIAEDEDINYILMVKQLSSLDLNIIRAINGLDAVVKCESNPDIDLVLMDIKMPEMDGFEATSRIKAMRPDLPIVAQTAFTTESDKKRAFECGCTDFITKPIDRQLLIDKVKNLLGI